MNWFPFLLFFIDNNRLNDNVVYHYNALNQLTETLTKDTIVTYEYDANGLRTKKTVNGEETVYVWDGDQLVMELSKSGKVQKRYIRGLDLVYTDTGENSTSRETQEKQYYVTDLHGNVTQLLDESGDVIKTYEYDAFGNEAKPDKKDDNPFRYCGEYYDKETDSVYLRARYYAPELGRFTTRDTYTGEDDDPLSLHLYMYCENDGVNAIDPSGHKKNFERYFNKHYKKIKPHKYNAIRVKLKGNQVKVHSRLTLAGGNKDIRKRIKKGIEKIWSGSVKIKGYKVKVKTSLKTKFDMNVGDYDYFRYVNEPGTSYVDAKTSWEIDTMHTGRIYSKFPDGKKRTKKQLQNTAAHEFGHLLGIANTPKDKKGPPNTDIMRWYNKVDVKMSNYDVLMFLKAAAYRKEQTWDKIKKRDVKK